MGHTVTVWAERMCLNVTRQEEEASPRRAVPQPQTQALFDSTKFHLLDESYPPHPGLSLGGPRSGARSAQTTANKVWLIYFRLN